MTSHRAHRFGIYAAVFLISFAANALIALQWPREGGDWDSYGTVAENIYQGHGVSLSTSPPYEPAFGGNSFPGYPAFIALVWKVFGKSNDAVRLAQALVFALALALFSWSVDRAFPERRFLGGAFGFFTALSPLTMAWSRSLQVEALSMASILLFFSAVLYSRAKEKVAVVPLSLALLFATALRTDGPLLWAALLGLLAAPSMSKKTVIRGIVAVGLITIVGISVWFARNAIVGAQHILPPGMIVLHDGQVYPAPKGYILWGWTWMSKEYERGGWGFPVTRAGYDSIFISDSAYDDAQEKYEIEALLEELRAYSGNPFPSHIDNRFREIALKKIKDHPFRVFVVLPLKRAFHLWIRPGGSAGWPIELLDLSYETRVEMEKGYLSAAWTLVRTHPVEVIGKGVVFSLTLLEYLMGALGLLFLFRRRANDVAVAILSYLVVRTGFYAFTNNVENRYMAQCIPLLHFLTVYSATVMYETLKIRSTGKRDVVFTDSVAV